MNEERSCKADRNRNCPEHLLAVPFVGGFDARCIDCEKVQICSKFFFDGLRHSEMRLLASVPWEDSGDPWEDYSPNAGQTRSQILYFPPRPSSRRVRQDVNIISY